ncbi:MAG: hypothetical protein KTR25_08005 [Myxococcales bacterium]|nr:hypothetical protein [Myxococcales bacterium]
MGFLRLVGWTFWIFGQFWYRTFVWAGLIGLTALVGLSMVNAYEVMQRPSVYVSVSSIAMLMALGQTGSYLFGRYVSARESRLSARAQVTLKLKRRLPRSLGVMPGVGDAQSSVLVPAKAEHSDWGASDTEWNIGMVETDWGEID